jgi:hypothetical protein
MEEENKYKKLFNYVVEKPENLLIMVIIIVVCIKFGQMIFK